MTMRRGRGVTFMRVLSLERRAALFDSSSFLPLNLVNFCSFAAVCAAGCAPTHFYPSLLYTSSTRHPVGPWSPPRTIANSFCKTNSNGCCQAQHDSHHRHCHYAVWRVALRPVLHRSEHRYPGLLCDLRRRYAVLFGRGSRQRYECTTP